MSREKQIEEIDELQMVLYEANHKKSVLDYRWLATEAYNAGYRKQEWISVDERLPEETETELDTVQGEDRTTVIAKVSDLVLIYSKHPEKPYVTVDVTVNGTWANNWYVTHWMPLPEAPKGGAE